MLDTRLNNLSIDSLFVGGVSGVFFLFLFFLNSCNTENAPDCLQNAGDIKRIELMLPSFHSITVFERLNLVLKQGEEQKVEIESGEFLLDEITAEVNDGRLSVRNNNGCNLLRDYGISTVYVTSPNISEVRSSTGLTVKSDGVLNYPNLTLLSESFNEPEAETTSGSFDLEIENESIAIVVNGIAYFNLKGSTQNLNITIAAGDTRIEANNLIANAVNVNHRGTNDVLVNPQQRISGTIRGYGDVISYNRPEEVNVVESFEGRLVFID